jgi:hypothetical protein
MASVYDLGDLVRVTFTFKDASGVVADPSVVRFEWKLEQGGTPTAFLYPTGIVKDSTGVYHYDIDASAEGTYFYRAWSTGTGQAAAEDSFFVKSNF